MVDSIPLPHRGGAADPAPPLPLQSRAVLACVMPAAGRALIVVVQPSASAAREVTSALLERAWKEAVTLGEKNMQYNTQVGGREQAVQYTGGDR